MRNNINYLDDFQYYIQGINKYTLRNELRGN